MDVAAIGQRLRASLESPPRAAASDAIALISVSVGQITSSLPGSSVPFVVPLEKELLDIYENSVQHNSVKHLETFLSVLFTLRPILPASSIITWFDHLRTALREPRLGKDATQGLRDLLSSALIDHAHVSESRSREFRKHILELYLYDAAEALSVEEAIESLTQSPDENETRKTWRENLESVLVTDAAACPNESFILLNAMFSNPSARFNITTLLARIFSWNIKPPPIVELVQSPFLDTCITSLLVDSSATLFGKQIITLLMLLPHMAVRTPEKLREILPKLLAILARALCWKSRSPSADLEDPDDDLEAQGYNDSSPRPVMRAVFLEKNDNDIAGTGHGVDYNALMVRPELDWIRMDKSPADDNTIIDASLYFTFMYGLFPCNTIAFLQRPIIHLDDCNFQSPFTVPWAEIVDVDGVRARSLPILQNHACHPCIMYRDAKSELTDPQSWTTARSHTDDVARVVAECTRLDNSHRDLDTDEIVRNSLSRDGLFPPPAGESNRESIRSTPRARVGDHLFPADVFHHSSVLEDKNSSPQQRFEEGQTSMLFSGSLSGECSSERQPSERRERSPRTPGMQLTTLAHPSPLSLSTLPLPAISAPPSPRANSQDSQGLREESTSTNRAAEETIRILQRESAQLRDLYHFARWMKNQLKHHVEGSHQYRILIAGEEFERQGLHNRLREYKSRIKAADKEINDLKELAEKSRKEMMIWVDQLQSRIASFRKEKASWTLEALSLRGEVKDATGMLKAQKALLAEAQTKVAELSNRMHFLEPKVAQIAEYELQIEQLSKRASMDDSEEIKALKADRKALDEARRQIVNNKLLLGSLEHANQELQRIAQERAAEIQRLNQRLAAAPVRSPRSSINKTPSPRYRPISVSANPLRPQQPSSPEEVDKITKLEAENLELKEDVQSLTVMVEQLRADGERARIRQVNEQRRSLNSPSTKTPKGTLSPATLSRTDLTELLPVPPLNLDK